MFVEPVGGWASGTQTAKLTASDGAGYDDFLGLSVAISGNTIVAGAPQAPINGNTLHGAVYVFVEPVGGWASVTQTAKLTASDGATFDELGDAVAIAGNTIVAGAPFATVNGNGSQGAAYVFVQPAAGWASGTQTAKLTASNGGVSDQLGSSVAISGNTIVAGADSATVNSNSLQGAVYVFDEPAGGWADATQTAKLTASNGAAGNSLGTSVANMGNTLVAGAPGADGGTGAVYVFGSVAATALSSSLSGGGQSGPTISVPAGTAVTDSATLTGTSASAATGTVTYNVYSDSACSKLVTSTGGGSVIGGVLPSSSAEALSRPGTYYWQASYSGDGVNQPSSSPCGSEVETVTPVGPSIDAQASGQAITSATAHLSTSAPGDLLVAFVASNSPTSGGQTSIVSGDGLTWTLVGRENKNLGDAEIWTARATGALSNAAITATVTKTGWDETITVIAFENAPGTGKVAMFTSMKGAPASSLSTSQANSWVFAIGNDWLKSISRTLGTGQTLIHQAFDNVGDTYWVQATNAFTPTAGTSVRINDTAPSTDPYNLVLVEIL